MENSKIVINYIKSKNAKFNGKTDQDIVKWFANSIKQTKATEIQKQRRHQLHKI